MIVTVQDQEVPRKKENNQQMIAGVQDQMFNFPAKRQTGQGIIHHPPIKGHHNTSNKQETTIKMTSRQRTRNAGHSPIIWNIYGTD